MNLTEAFKALDSLNEDVFSVDSEGIEKLQQFIQSDDTLDELSVYDLDASDDEEAKNACHEGDLILNCVVCHSDIYKNPDDVVVDSETGLACTGEECPYCFSVDGYKVRPYKVVPIGDELEIKSDNKESESDETINNDSVNKTDSVDTQEAKKDLNEAVNPENAEMNAKILNTLKTKDTKEPKFRKDLEAAGYKLKKGSDSRSAYGYWEVEGPNGQSVNISKGYDKQRRAYKGFNALTNDKSSIDKVDYHNLMTQDRTVRDEFAAAGGHSYFKKGPNFLPKTDVQKYKEIQDDKNRAQDMVDYYGKDIANTTSQIDELKQQRDRYIQYQKDSQQEVDDAEKARKELLRKRGIKVESFKESSTQDLSTTEGTIANLLANNMSTLKSITDPTEMKNAIMDIVNNSELAGSSGAKKLERALYSKKSLTALWSTIATFMTGQKSQLVASFNRNKKRVKEATDLANTEGTIANLLSKHSAELNSISDVYKLRDKIIDIIDSSELADTKAATEMKRNLTTRKSISALMSTIATYMTGQKSQLVASFNTNRRPIKEDIDEIEIKSNDLEIEVKSKESSKEDKEEILEPLSAEEKEEIEIPIDDIDKNSISEIGESFLKENFANVKFFRAGKVVPHKNCFIVEGIIGFNSGKKKNTTFKFTPFKANGTSVSFLGENFDITNLKNAVTLRGQVRNNKFISESLHANHTIPEWYDHSKIVKLISQIFEIPSILAEDYVQIFEDKGSYFEYKSLKDYMKFLFKEILYYVAWDDDFEEDDFEDYVDPYEMVFEGDPNPENPDSYQRMRLNYEKIMASL